MSTSIFVLCLKTCSGNRNNHYVRFSFRQDKLEEAEGERMIRLGEVHEMIASEQMKIILTVSKRSQTDHVFSGKKNSDASFGNINANCHTLLNVLNAEINAPRKCGRGGVESTRGRQNAEL